MSKFTTKSTPVRLPNDLLDEINSHRGKRSLVDFIRDIVRGDDSVEVSKSAIGEILERLSTLESSMAVIIRDRLEDLKPEPDSDYGSTNDFASFMGYIYQNLTDERVEALKSYIVESGRYAGETLQIVKKVLARSVEFTPREQFILGLAGSYHQRKYDRVSWEHFWGIAHPAFFNILLMLDEIPSAITSVEIMEIEGDVDYSEADTRAFSYTCTAIDFKGKEEVCEGNEKPASEVRERV